MKLKAGKIKMELMLSPDQKQELREFADKYTSYESETSNMSDVVRMCMDKALSGEINIPKNNSGMLRNPSNAKRYRPVVYEDTRDKFLKFCRELHYAPNQVIMYVIRQLKEKE